MATLSQSSSRTFKVVFISTGVLFTAVILKQLCAPVITELASSNMPPIWSVLALWLRPPYLYVVINCIIITIVASSKLQQKFVDESPPETLILPAPITVTADYSSVVDGVAVKNASVEVQPQFSYGYDANVVKDVYEHIDDAVLETETKTKTTTTTTLAVYSAEEMSGEDELAISRSLWTPQTYEKPPVSVRIGHRKAVKSSPEGTAEEMSGEDELAISRSLWTPQTYEKPPVSVRIGHRKAVKSSPEGGRTLRVSKPKRHDTLETTWKTITEGRQMPLARHLKKSDTWETHGGRVAHNLHEHDNKMIKSETLNGPTNEAGGKLKREPSGSGKLRKEPSPSQDELNRRVEAFIKKFNEDMRLQRQESLNQYTEMINRGAQY